MRISDWSSDVCSSDLVAGNPFRASVEGRLLGSDSSWRSATALNTRGFSAIQATAIRLTDPRAAMAMMTPRRNRMARAGLVRIAKVSGTTFGAGEMTASLIDRKSVELGTGVSGSGDRGGRRIIKNKTNHINPT